jgi:hypothetical protein
MHAQSTKGRSQIDNNRVYLEVRTNMTTGGTLVNRRHTSGPVCQETKTELVPELTVRYICDERSITAEAIMSRGPLDLAACGELIRRTHPARTTVKQLMTMLYRELVFATAHDTMGSIISSRLSN